MPMSRPFTGAEERGFKLLAFLEEHPATADETCEVLGWSKSQFQSALSYARNHLGPKIGVAIPHPVPEDGYRYHVSAEWTHADGTPAIAAGTAYAMGIIETRLKAVMRDVSIARLNLDSRSVDGRKANFLNKHLAHILAVLAEIGPGPQPGDDE